MADKAPSFTQAALTVGAILALIYGGAVAVLSLEKTPPQIPQAEFVAAHEQFINPLPCDVRVSDGMTSVTMTRARCYMTKATRGSK